MSYAYHPIYRDVDQNIKSPHNMQGSPMYYQHAIPSAFSASSASSSSLVFTPSPSWTSCTSPSTSVTTPSNADSPSSSELSRSFGSGKGDGGSLGEVGEDGFGMGASYEWQQAGAGREVSGRRGGVRVSPKKLSKKSSIHHHSPPSGNRRLPSLRKPQEAEVQVVDRTVVHPARPPTLNKLPPKKARAVARTKSPRSPEQAVRRTRSEDGGTRDYLSSKPAVVASAKTKRTTPPAPQPHTRPRNAAAVSRREVDVTTALSVSGDGNRTRPSAFQDQSRQRPDAGRSNSMLAVAETVHMTPLSEIEQSMFRRAAKSTTEADTPPPLPDKSAGFADASDRSLSIAAAAAAAAAGSDADEARAAAFKVKRKPVPEVKERRRAQADWGRVDHRDKWHEQAVMVQRMRSASLSEVTEPLTAARAGFAVAETAAPTKVEHARDTNDIGRTGGPEIEWKPFKPRELILARSASASASASTATAMRKNADKPRPAPLEPPRSLKKQRSLHELYRSPKMYDDFSQARMYDDSALMGDDAESPLPEMLASPMPPAASPGGVVGHGRSMQNHLLFPDSALSRPRLRHATVDKAQDARENRQHWRTQSLVGDVIVTSDGWSDVSSRSKVRRTTTTTEQAQAEAARGESRQHRRMHSLVGDVVVTAEAAQRGSGSDGWARVGEIIKEMNIRSPLPPVSDGERSAGPAATSMRASAMAAVPSTPQRRHAPSSTHVRSRTISGAGSARLQLATAAAEMATAAVTAAGGRPPADAPISPEADETSPMEAQSSVPPLRLRPATTATATQQGRLMEKDKEMMDRQAHDAPKERRLAGAWDVASPGPGESGPRFVLAGMKDVQAHRTHKRGDSGAGAGAGAGGAAHQTPESVGKLQRRARQAAEARRAAEGGPSSSRKVQSLA